MNTFGIIILILFIMALICSIYLFAGRGQVNKIMGRENNGLYNNLQKFQDLISLHNTFRNNKNISNYERKFLKQYFIFYISAILLLIGLFYFIFSTNW